LTTIKSDIENNLELNAKLVNNLNKLDQKSITMLGYFLENRTSIDIIFINKKQKIYHSNYKKDGRSFYKIEYPSTDIKNSFITITKDMTTTFDTIDKIFQNLFIFAFIGLFFVILYAVTISKVLTLPINKFSKLIANTDTNNIQTLDKATMPYEFHPIVVSLNKLANKVKSHILYQKELYIGITHELKTPLSVIKLKNDIMLKKPRTIEQYKETLLLNLSETDKMTNIVSSVMEMGRQEATKFEHEKYIDVASSVKVVVNDFSFIAQKSYKIKLKNNIENIKLKIQPTMFSQIVQNLLQNAIKFAKENSEIIVSLEKQQQYVYIKIINEGQTIDESVDYFAPFIRYGDKQGVGLGLYLSKNASDTIGSQIYLKNRDDGLDGVVATLKIIC